MYFDIKIKTVALVACIHAMAFKIEIYVFLLLRGVLFCLKKNPIFLIFFYYKGSTTGCTRWYFCGSGWWSRAIYSYWTLDSYASDFLQLNGIDYDWYAFYLFYPNDLCCLLGQKFKWNNIYKLFDFAIITMNQK